MPAHGWLTCLTIPLLFPLFLHAEDKPPVKERLVYEKPAGAIDQPLQINPFKGPNAHFPHDFALSVLCPAHTGLTVQERPSIFWFMNEPVKGAAYKVTIYKDGDAKPLLEKECDPEKDTGIQRLNLKEISRKLETDSEYAVSVAIIADPTSHTGDLVITGHIKRITPPDKLISRLLTRPTAAERAIVYARQGIWYDALAAISDQIAADPSNKDLHAERADLLMQVGLSEAADYDRRWTGK